MPKTIYILKHPQKGFTGYLLGVGFQNGIGSTNSMQDMRRICDPTEKDRHPDTGEFRFPKCTNITAEYYANKKKAEALEKARKVKAEKTKKRDAEKESKEEKKKAEESEAE